MPDLYNYWGRITSFKSSLGKKETRMFYAANVIMLGVVLELLWKFTLLVCFKLNRFRPSQVNRFDIHVVLFGGDSNFKPLDKIVFFN